MMIPSRATRTAGRTAPRADGWAKYNRCAMKEVEFGTIFANRGCVYKFVIMKRLYLFLSFLLPVCGIVLAQGHPQGSFPQRSAEECALKQTQMMVRELGITDTLQYRALFDMHLKYARLRENGCSRAQMMQYMEDSNKELKQLLTKEQYEAYMNRQVQSGPHGPQPPVGRFAGQGTSDQRPRHPHKGHPQCRPDSVHQGTSGYRH